MTLGFCKKAIRSVLDLLVAMVQRCHNRLQPVQVELPRESSVNIRLKSEAASQQLMNLAARKPKAHEFQFVVGGVSAKERNRQPETIMHHDPD